MVSVSRNLYEVVLGPYIFFYFQIPIRKDIFELDISAITIYRR